MAAADERQSRPAERALCAAFRRERSQNGKKLPELKSGLQKYIRRGEREKALWCAGELHSFRDAPERDQARRVGTNFRHRLMIIFLEDVGAIGLWERADALNARALDADAVYRWVAMMAGARKSRACSHARAVASIRVSLIGGANHPSVPRASAAACALYPTIAALHARHKLDPRAENELLWRPALVEALHERSPAACIWAWAIQTEGRPRTAPGGRKSVWQIFEALEVGCEPAIARLIPMARRWYKDLQNTREAFLCWMLPLLAQVGEHPLDGNVRVVGGPVPASAEEAFAAQPPMELDSYVYDMHVAGAGAPGRGRGGLVRFANEGSLVANESEIVDPVWKAFYNDRKRLDEWVAPVGPPAVEPPGAASAISGANQDPLPDDFIDDLIAEFHRRVEPTIDDVFRSPGVEGGIAGNKPICAPLLPDSDLPFDEDGVAPGIIASPHSLAGETPRRGRPE
jgi:hypothetical protein